MLNERARAIYDYIKGRVSVGMTPSVREICADLEIKSTATVYRYINLLVSEGYLDKVYHHSRSLRLKERHTLKVPVLHTMAGEHPAKNLENVNYYISYNTARTFGAPLVACCVEDDNAAGDGVLRGDLIIVELGSAVEPDGLLLVERDGAWLLTRAAQEADQLCGRVVALIRDLLCTTAPEETVRVSSAEEPA